MVISAIAAIATTQCHCRRRLTVLSIPHATPKIVCRLLCSFSITTTMQKRYHTINVLAYVMAEQIFALTMLNNHRMRMLSCLATMYKSPGVCACVRVWQTRTHTQPEMAMKMIPVCMHARTHATDVILNNTTDGGGGTPGCAICFLCCS